MLENLARKVGGQRRVQTLCGVALGAAGLLIIVLPTALRLRRSLAALATVRSAYASKLSWAGKKGQIEAVQDPDLKMLLQYKSPSQQEYLKNRYLKRKNRELEQ